MNKVFLVSMFFLLLLARNDMSSAQETLPSVPVVSPTKEVKQLEILPSLSLFVSIAAFGLSIYSFYVNQKRAAQPVIIFSNGGKDETGTRAWYAENVGNGPAINVLLLGGISDKDWDKDNVLLLPALSKGAKHKLNFQKGLAFAAVYTDIADRPYTTTVYDNKNKIYEKNILPGISATKFLWQE